MQHTHTHTNTSSSMVKREEKHHFVHDLLIACTIHTCLTSKTQGPWTKLYNQYATCYDVVSLEVPRYWVMTCVGRSLVESTPVLVLFRKLTVPNTFNMPT